MLLPSLFPTTTRTTTTTTTTITSTTYYCCHCPKERKTKKNCATLLMLYVNFGFHSEAEFFSTQIDCKRNEMKTKPANLNMTAKMWCATEKLRMKLVVVAADSSLSLFLISILRYACELIGIRVHGFNWHTLTDR